MLAVALVSVALGLATGEAARRREDARIFLVSLAFLTSAGFLGLHALATPGVLLESPNAGFVIATPIGLLLASALAAASALDLSPRRSAAVVRRQRLLRATAGAVLVAWGAVSLANVPPLDDPLSPERAEGPLRALAVVGTALYGFAAVRYVALYRSRRSMLALAVVTAFALLAEAMIAIAFARNWHASWWEWHVLMALAFSLVALAARAEYRRRGSTAGIFSDLYLEQTIERIDHRYAGALEEVMAALARGEPVDPVVEAARRHARLSEDEARFLERAATEIRELDRLFRPYLSPQLAARLREDPDAARLGGEEREISVLFADLQGFTAFSERSPATEVIAMLNEYWARAVPVVAEGENGMIERFAGDAIMVVFNAALDQDDHALRAARAAVGLQLETERIAAEHPGWPRFRVGVNTGPAVVGNVGVAEQRSFSAIGETTNLAARLQAAAEPGSVVIGEATYAEIREHADVERLQPLAVKGKAEPVQAYVLRGVAADSGYAGAGGRDEVKRATRG